MSTESRSSWNKALSCGVLISFAHLMSSATWKTGNASQLLVHRSFTNTKNSSRPNMLPWRDPRLHRRQFRTTIIQTEISYIIISRYHHSLLGSVASATVLYGKHCGTPWKSPGSLTLQMLMLVGEAKFKMAISIFHQNVHLCIFYWGKSKFGHWIVDHFEVVCVSTCELSDTWLMYCESCSHFN